jgi:hypothetical protein
MAQQARPKSIYHCEDARAQLRRSSTFVVMLSKTSLPEQISIDNLNFIGKYIQSETVIPVNIYEVTTKIFDFVLDGPFGGSPNYPLVAFDSSNGTAFDSL